MTASPFLRGDALEAASLAAEIDRRVDASEAARQRGDLKAAVADLCIAVRLNGALNRLLRQAHRAAAAAGHAPN